MAWRMVVPGAYLTRQVLAALGVCVCCMCWLYVSRMLGAHPVQEGSGPCKISNLSHLLWSDETHLLARDEVKYNLDYIKMWLTAEWATLPGA